MNTKQLIALAALAFAGTAALADDITIVKDDFVAQKTRAEVRAEAIAAKQGQAVTSQEVDASLPVAARSDVTRDQVRAELRNTPRRGVVMFNEAA